MNEVQKLEILFQTLGVANRLSIIGCIGSGEKNVGEIVKELSLSQPLVSHHLRALREKNILVSHRKGPFIYYRLKNAKLLEILGALSEIASVIRDESRTDGIFCCPDWWSRRRVRRRKGE